MAPRVLLVDDDPNILASYSRNLRKSFEVTTAQGGEEALARIRTDPPYAVILTDMRMPGMDGIAFLTQARNLAPDATRIMLTGNADMQTAVDGVNQGHLFRFLTKPCDPETLAQALDQGVKQHLLVTSEKELVEGTVNGSVDLLVELLATVSPDSFAHSQRVAPLAEKIARVMEVPAPWVVKVASLLARIGIVTIPSQVVAKLNAGLPITVKEHEALTRLPEIGANFLRHIPRMDRVGRAIHYMQKNFNGSGFPTDPMRGEEIPLESRILRVASDFIGFLDQRSGGKAVLEEMRQKTLFYDPRVLNALSLALDVPDVVLEEADALPREVMHWSVELGDILVDGVTTLDGLMVYPPNTRVGWSHLERLTNFAKLVGLKEPFRVRGGR